MTNSLLNSGAQLSHACLPFALVRFQTINWIALERGRSEKERKMPRFHRSLAHRYVYHVSRIFRNQNVEQKLRTKNVRHKKCG